MEVWEAKEWKKVNDTTFEYRGHTVRIFQDEYPENPRLMWDNFGTMICFHDRYRLGDEHDYKFPADFVYDWAAHYFNNDKVHRDFMEMASTEFIDTYLTKLEKYLIILPLYLYDHSGLTMNTTGFSCPWDSGQVGWIFVKKEDVRKEYSKTKLTPKIRKKAIELLMGEVNIYDQFLCGEVYGYTITDLTGEETDSCGGFFGDPEDYMISEIQSIIDSRINDND
jgi:hypothetical protein